MARTARTAYHYRQQAVADIAIRLIVADSNGAFYPVIDDIINAYGLHYDPFTRLPCTTYDYTLSCIEYDRQTMEERGYI